MRILVALLMVALSAMFGAQAVRAADMPEIQVPEVDYGLQGSFYLRGSVAGNLLWTQQHIDLCGCSVPPTAAGYGYSVGAGFGYETGSGLRVDGTLDYLQNDGETDGTYALHLKGAVALANIYYDFPLGGMGMGSAGGGFGAYLGAGAGATFYKTSVSGPAPLPADGSAWTPTAAAMAGLSYDAGNWVADVGFRLLYLPTITNNVSGAGNYFLYDNTVHEVRGTVRYRFQ
jgi:hypothetical protein